MKKKRNPVKILSISAVSAVVLLLAVFAGLSAYKGYSLVNPERKMLHSSPDELGLVFENVEFAKLSGWFIPAQQRGGEEPQESNKTVIFSHNYQSNREMLEISGLYYARYLANAGYNVLLFDYSGSGMSDGEGYALGASEVPELRAAVQYVKNRNPESNIALQGWAFGAAAALMAGAREEAVTTVIADSSYAELNKNLDVFLPIWTNLPALFNAPVKAFAQLFSGTDFAAASPLQAVGQMQGKNLLFIHGLADSVIDPEDCKTLYNAAKDENSAQIWLISNCRHIYGFMEQEDNYVSKTISFLDAAMP